MNATDIASEHLEELLSEDCKCQSVHRLPGGRMCSEEVVSLAVMSCEPARLICFNATLASLNWINAGGTCTCYNAAAECWSIQPV